MAVNTDKGIDGHCRFWYMFVPFLFVFNIAITDA